MLERLGPQNLVRLIMERAAVMPDQVAITTADESVTYAQLVDLTVQFARHLRRQNVRAGMRIAIMPDHPIIAVGLSLACSLIGCAWIAGTAHVLAHPGLGISHLLCMNIPPAGSRVPCVFVDPSWTRPPQDGRVDAPFTGYANAQQTWMIARSSGTTGEAKFIGLSEAAFYRRATENNFISEAERPVYLALFPLLAYTGTLAMMRTLAIGGTFIYADPGETYGRTRIDVMHGSPAQLQQFMDTSPPNGRRIPLARMGGGVAGAGLFRRLLLYFDRIMHVYGSTEAATTATRIIGAADIGDMTPSVGRAVAGVQVEIVEPDGVRLPAGQEGIVRIRTPSQVSSYIGDPELSAAAFRAGWFHPGDLGVLSADGELRITGRVNDQLNVGGVKLRKRPKTTTSV